jgi:hypothetical protein
MRSLVARQQPAPNEFSANHGSVDCSPFTDAPRDQPLIAFG